MSNGQDSRVGLLVVGAGLDFRPCIFGLIRERVISHNAGVASRSYLSVDWSIFEKQGVGIWWQGD